MRRGATVGAPESAPTYYQFPNVPVIASPASPAVDACALSDGLKKARPISPEDMVTSGANAPASVVLPAPGPGRSRAIHGVDGGYSATPTGGQLTITDGTTLFRVPVTTAGPIQFDFQPPLIFAPNAAVSGSLSAAGAGVSGYFAFTGRSLV